MNFIQRKLKKASKYLAIFTLIFAWVFSGWPPVWNFPPKIQEARADTDTYYGTYDSANSDMTSSVNAETDNTQYAYGDKNKKAVIQSWSGTAGSGAISGIRIYCQHYATTPDGNDFTLVDYSLDNWVTTGTTTGQQVMPSSEASFSVDVFADRAWNWTDIGNLEVRATAKASGKQNFTDDYIDVLYIQVDYSAVVISITVSDAEVVYGTVATSADTTGGGGDTQTVTNNGNVAEDFDIKGQNSASWTLGGSAGNAIYKHAWCTSDCDGTPTWNALTTTYDSTYLATNVPASGTQDFDLQVTVPTSNAGTSQQTVSVFILATQH